MNFPWLRSPSNPETAMIYNPHFDVDAVLTACAPSTRSTRKAHRRTKPSESPRWRCSTSVNSRSWTTYREFLRSFYTPAIDSIAVAQTFATREEADVWLAGGSAKEGDLVRIAGQGFQLMPKRKGTGLRFVRMPLPEELMKNPPTESK